MNEGMRSSVEGAAGRASVAGAAGRASVAGAACRASVAGAADRAGAADGLCPGKKLSFGCMRLPVVGEGHARIDLAEFERMADEFLDRGFTYFDTAWMYHEQASERAVGEAVVARHARDSFTLATKMPLSMLPDAARRELARSFPDSTPAELAIRYAASLDNVMCVLSGMSTSAQLDENTRFMGGFEPIEEGGRLAFVRAARPRILAVRRHAGARGLFSYNIPSYRNVITSGKRDRHPAPSRGHAGCRSFFYRRPEARTRMTERAS